MVSPRGTAAREHERMGDDRHIADAAEDLPALQKPILVRSRGMRRDFDGELARERGDAPQPARGLERREREEEVVETMTPGQGTVDRLPVPPVPHALLAGLKGEVPAHERAGREQALTAHVRAQVRVMMAVDPLGLRAVEPAEFVHLRRHDVLERASQTRMHRDCREAATPQIAGDFLLTFHQAARARARRERAW